MIEIMLRKTSILLLESRNQQQVLWKIVLWVFFEPAFFCREQSSVGHPENKETCFLIL